MPLGGYRGSLDI